MRSRSENEVRTTTAVPGSAREQLAGGLDAVLARHLEVHQDDVGLVLGGQADGLVAARGGADERDVVERAEQLLQPRERERVVVGGEDADHRLGASSSTRRAAAGRAVHGEPAAGVGGEVLEEREPAVPAGAPAGELVGR